MKDRKKEKIEELENILKNNLYITQEYYGVPEAMLKQKIELLQELLEKEGN